MEAAMKYPLATGSWDDREREAILRVIDSDRFTMGTVVAEFEQQFADFFGARHAVMSNSGSSANLLAVAATLYRSQNALQPGDEVIVPAVSWGTTYFPLQQHGLKLKFVDVSPTDFNLNVDQVEMAIGPNTKAIFAVNLLGVPCDFTRLTAICDEHDLLLLEDNCESMGAQLHDKQCGTFGLAGTYSTFFSHHICTIEGGMTLTDDEELCQIMRSLRSHGWTREPLPPHLTPIADSTSSDFHNLFQFVLPGYNVRPNEIFAALGQEQLKKLPSIVKGRQANHDHLVARFAEFEKRNPGLLRIQSPQTSGTSASWFGFAFVLSEYCAASRDAVVAALKANDIECRPIVAGNFTRNPVMRYLDSSIHGSLDVADSLHDRGFFVGNSHCDLSSSIDHLLDVLEFALTVSRREAA